MLNELKNEMNLTLTQNSALTHRTSNSYVLDFFAQGGSLRNRSEKDIISLFSKAYNENPLFALKLLFYIRDCRGGQGERRTFRKIIKYLANFYPDNIRINLNNIINFGRYDDLFILLDTQLELDVLEIIKKQFNEDINSNYPSLLCKWIPSLNSKNKIKKEQAYKIKKSLGLNRKEFRKQIALIRSKLKIVEKLLTNRQYSEIEYSKLPSKSNLIYKNAFYNNDFDRYNKYIQDLVNNKKKINVKTLYPYEIVRNIMGANINNIKLLNKMWDSLPDYVGDNYTNSIAVIDVSGSMYGLPIYIAISLGLYLAEKNKGTFANHFITFSNNPQLVEIVGNNLFEKVSNIENADWGCSTNIESVFNLILKTALKYKLPQSELPDRIIIISDMEFNNCDISFCRGYWSDEEVPDEAKTLMENIEKDFIKNNYKMPKLVFWNVNSMQNNIPMKMYENIQLISGASPVLFEHVLQDKFIDAYELMLKVINNKRYNCIRYVEE